MEAEIRVVLLAIASVLFIVLELEVQVQSFPLYPMHLPGIRSRTLHVSSKVNGAMDRLGNRTRNSIDNLARTHPLTDTTRIASLPSFVVLSSDLAYVGSDDDGDHEDVDFDIFGIDETTKSSTSGKHRRGHRLAFQSTASANVNPRTSTSGNSTARYNKRNNVRSHMSTSSRIRAQTIQDMYLEFIRYDKLSYFLAAFNPDYDAATGAVKPTGIPPEGLDQSDVEGNYVEPDIRKSSAAISSSIDSATYQKNDNNNNNNNSSSSSDDNVDKNSDNNYAASSLSPSDLNYMVTYLLGRMDRSFLVPFCESVLMRDPSIPVSLRATSVTPVALNPQEDYDKAQLFPMKQKGDLAFDIRTYTAAMSALNRVKEYDLVVVIFNYLKKRSEQQQQQQQRYCDGATAQSDHHDETVPTEGTELAEPKQEPAVDSCGEIEGDDVHLDVIVYKCVVRAAGYCRPFSFTLQLLEEAYRLFGATAVQSVAQTAIINLKYSDRNQFYSSSHTSNRRRHSTSFTHSQAEEEVEEDEEEEMDDAGTGKSYIQQAERIFEWLVTTLETPSTNADGKSTYREIKKKRNKKRKDPEISSRISIQTLDALLAVVCIYGTTSDCNRIVRRYADFNVALSVFTCNTLLDRAARRKDTREACKIIDYMQKFDIKGDGVTYNSLLKLYVNLQDVQSAQKILAQMEARGIRASERTTTLLMRLYRSTRAHKQALALVMHAEDKVVSAAMLANGIDACAAAIATAVTTTTSAATTAASPGIVTSRTGGMELYRNPPAASHKQQQQQQQQQEEQEQTIATTEATLPETASHHLAVALGLLQRAHRLNLCDEAVLVAAAKCSAGKLDYARAFSLLDSIVQRKHLHFNKYVLSFALRICGEVLSIDNHAPDGDEEESVKEEENLLVEIVAYDKPAATVQAASITGQADHATITGYRDSRRHQALDRMIQYVVLCGRRYPYLLTEIVCRKVSSILMASDLAPLVACLVADWFPVDALLDTFTVSSSSSSGNRNTKKTATNNNKPRRQHRDHSDQKPTAPNQHHRRLGRTANGLFLALQAAGVSLQKQQQQQQKLDGGSSSSKTSTTTATTTTTTTTPDSASSEWSGVVRSYLNTTSSKGISEAPTTGTVADLLQQQIRKPPQSPPSPLLPPLAIPVDQMTDGQLLGQISLRLLLKLTHGTHYGSKGKGKGKGSKNSRVNSVDLSPRHFNIVLRLLCGGASESISMDTIAHTELQQIQRVSMFVEVMQQYQNQSNYQQQQQEQEQEVVGRRRRIASTFTIAEIVRFARRTTLSLSTAAAEPTTRTVFGSPAGGPAEDGINVSTEPTAKKKKNIEEEGEKIALAAGVVTRSQTQNAAVELVMTALRWAIDDGVFLPFAVISDALSFVYGVGRTEVVIDLYRQLYSAGYVNHWLHGNVPSYNSHSDISTSSSRQTIVDGEKILNAHENRQRQLQKVQCEPVENQDVSTDPSSSSLSSSSSSSSSSFSWFVEMDLHEYSRGMAFAAINVAIEEMHSLYQHHHQLQQQQQEQEQEQEQEQQSLTQDLHEDSDVPFPSPPPPPPQVLTIITGRNIANRNRVSTSASIVNRRGGDDDGDGDNDGDNDNDKEDADGEGEGQRTSDTAEYRLSSEIQNVLIEDFFPPISSSTVPGNPGRLYITLPIHTHFSSTTTTSLTSSTSTTASDIEASIADAADTTGVDSTRDSHME